MDKRKLKLLEIKQLPSTASTSQISSGQTITHAFVAKRHTEGKELILVVTFFSLETRIAEFRVFFNKKTFITEILSPERKWSNATLDWFHDWHMRGSAICVNEKSEKLIHNFFKPKTYPFPPPFKIMQEFQRDFRKRQLQKRHKRETDQIDARMKAVKALPKDFNKWVNETALNFSRYIYYKRNTRRHIDGYCTSCKKDLEFYITKKTPYENIRHNLIGKCPVCKKAVTFKAIGKTTLQIDTTVAAYAQKTESGFIMRYFKITKRYFEHYRNPTLYINELMRDFHERDNKGVWQVHSFEYADYKQTHVIRWCKARSLYELEIACLYTRNLRHVMSDTDWKYSGIYELAKNTDKFNIYGYLRAYKQYPAYEYLVKLRLYRLVTGNVSSQTSNWNNLNFDGKGFQEVLGINREQLNQMQRLNGTYKYLRMIRSAGNVGVTLSDEQVETLIQMDVDSGIIAELLNYTTAHKIIGYVNRCLQTWKLPIDDMYVIQKPYHTITEYWKDYLQNCKLLSYDVKDDFILFPRDLKAAHDDVMKRYERKKNELQDQVITSMFEMLSSQFGFEYNGLIIRPPVSVDEIINEGKKLHHCVGTGSYIENMVKGKSYILFIRLAEQPDESFYTVEVSNGMLTQCRGKNNCDMTDDVKKFVAAWKKKKLQINEASKGA